MANDKWPISESEFNRPQKPLVLPQEVLVDQMIKQAVEKGKFSNLANEGRPIKIQEDNPYVPEDLKLAYKVLENGGFVPPWIELEKEVEAKLASVRKEQDRHRYWLKQQLDTIKNGPYHQFMRDIRRLANTHDEWLKKHAQRLTDMNNQIFQFNDVCPVPSLLKIPFRVDEAIAEYDKSCPTVPRV